MRRQRTHIIFLAVLAALSFMVAACQKKCQASGEPLKTFIDQELRVAETNDPSVKKELTNTNFLIMVFKINYTGEVFRVENNDKYDNPVRLFRYNVDPQRKMLRIQYYEPPSEESPGDGTVGEPIGDVKTYSYELDKEFRIRESGTGLRYRMVPFTGVVRPDEVCKF